MCFLSTTEHLNDDLTKAESDELHRMWSEVKEDIRSPDLRSYLLSEFFKAHLETYEKRPIYWPISSAHKNFCCVVNLYKLNKHSFNTILQTYLLPARIELERYADTNILLSDLCVELNGSSTPYKDTFNVLGPPGEREVNAEYNLELGDGVLLSAAALGHCCIHSGEHPK